MENVEIRDRKRIIQEITDRWISKNKEIFKDFAATVQGMRQLRPTENQAHIYKATIPGDLMRQLEFAISNEGEPRLFDPAGELKWFGEKYPEFIIPYDRSSSVR